jgi:hypothetical protein
MPLIVTTFQIVTPESAEQGDYEETGWIDEEGHDCTSDDVVDVAVAFISEQGSVKPSDYPACSPGHTWYTQTDPVQNRAYFEQGREETHSFHLRGFTPEQEVAIYAKLKER